MPEQDSQKPLLARFRPKEVLLCAKRSARAWARLPREKKTNRLLILVVSACGIAASWLFKQSFWVYLGVVAGIGILAFLWLVWRLRPNRDRKAPLSSRSKIVIAIVVVAIASSICLGVYRYLHDENRAKISRFHNHLKNSGLPEELYEHQKHLYTLTIDQAEPAKQPFLSDLDWLASDSLENLTLVSPNLKSLGDLARINKLHSLDVDLTGSPISSLHSLTSLHGLGSLQLRGIAKAKTAALVPEIGESLPELTTLYLDFHHSNLSTLPVLTACRQLQDLTLDLRSTTNISKAPDLSLLQNLRTLTMFADNSKVADLKPLSGNMSALRKLTLGLDGSQIGLLSHLAATEGPETLELRLSSSPNTMFPSLHGMKRLNSLTIHMPQSINGVIPERAPLPAEHKAAPLEVNKFPIPSVDYFPHLEELAVFLNGSDIAQLPEIGSLTDLLNLYLHLENSNVQKLPDISQLRKLQRLAIDVNNTNVAELPDLMPFPGLVELHLSVANDTKIRFLKIEKLNKLATLELDIRRKSTEDKIADLASLEKLNTLTNLTLRLKWEQVPDLPDLSQLKHLQILKLYMDGSWDPQQLPSFTGLDALEDLTLDLPESEIRKLPDFSGAPKLHTVKINLDRSGIEDLSSLGNINNLKELNLSLVSATRIQTLPSLRGLLKLQKVTVDISHSQITLSQTQNLAKLQELTVPRSFPSLKDLPETVTKLHFR